LAITSNNGEDNSSCGFYLKVLVVIWLSQNLIYGRPLSVEISREKSGAFLGFGL